MKKEQVYSLLIIAAMLSLFGCGAVDAETIRLYVPLGRSGNPPTNPYAFQMSSGEVKLKSWGQCQRWVEQNTGQFYISVKQAWAWAYAYTEGHIIQTAVTEDGSVHGDLFVRYFLRTGGAVQVVLQVEDRTAGQNWYKYETDNVATSTWKSRVFDFGISGNDLSWPNKLRFQWTQNHHYKIYMYCYLSSTSNATSSIDSTNSRIEHLILDAYTSDEAWTDYTGPDISIDPPTLPQTVNYVAITTMQFAVNGTGWIGPHTSPVNVTVDGTPVGDPTTPDEFGDFTCTFSMSTPMPGMHNVTATNGSASATSLIYRMSDTLPAGTTTLPGDITGANGIPDGKIDMRDISLLCLRFGWVDPNLPFPTIDTNMTYPPPEELLGGSLSRDLAQKTVTAAALASLLVAAPMLAHTKLKKKFKN